VYVKVIVGSVAAVVVASLVALLIRAELRADSEAFAKRAIMQSNVAVEQQMAVLQQRGANSQLYLARLTERCKALSRAGYDRPFLPSDWEDAREFDESVVADWAKRVPDGSFGEWRRDDVCITVEWVRPNEYAYTTARHKIDEKLTERHKAVMSKGREAMLIMIAPTKDIDRIWKELGL
jgi:hypothetical protein